MGIGKRKVEVRREKTLLTTHVNDTTKDPVDTKLSKKLFQGVLSTACAGLQWRLLNINVTFRGSHLQRSSARTRELVAWTLPKAKHAQHLVLTLDSRAAFLADAVLNSLPSLRVLDLRVQGRLQGLPRGLAALTKLHKLRIDAHDLNGALADCIEGLQELQTLEIILASTNDPYNPG